MTWATQTAARTLAQEARNQPVEGQRAVAWTFRNRIAAGKWGANLGQVCLWHGAYSGWWCPRGAPVYHDPNFAFACGLDDADALLVALEAIVAEVMAADPASDPTGGATHYYNPSAVPTPAWVTGDPSRGIPAAVFTVQIGAHRFYRGVQ